MSYPPITLQDDTGTEVALPGIPRRIVSLVPSLTETLFDLGAGERVVGITRWCVHPRDALADIPVIGGTKDPSIRRIAELHPDLIIANQEENRERHVTALREIAPVFVTYPRTVNGALKTIRDLAHLTGSPDAASPIVLNCESLLARADRLAQRFSTATMIWFEPWMAVGPDTYVSELLTRCGFTNVFVASEGRYPETTLASLIERRPDVILLPDEPFEFVESHRDQITRAFAAAGQRPNVFLLDGSYLTWFGSRTRHALRYLVDLGENRLANPI